MRNNRGSGRMPYAAGAAVFLLVAGMVALVVPMAAHAQVLITEIMYDLEGADSGREWIEVYNGGSGGVDLSVWRLFEYGTNHRLKAVGDDSVLAAREYAVLADNAELFQRDHPGFSGHLFDSSFSLRNTGELLSIRNPDGVDVDSVHYNADWGASGDGYSLQRVGGEWVAALPTPGLPNRRTQGRSPAAVPAAEDAAPESLSSAEEPLSPATADVHDGKVGDEEEIAEAYERPAAADKEASAPPLSAEDISGAGGRDGEGNIYIWLVALGALLVVAAAAVVAARQRAEATASEADEYTIRDDTPQ